MTNAAEDQGLTFNPKKAELGDRLARIRKRLSPADDDMSFAAAVRHLESIQATTESRGKR